MEAALRLLSVRERSAAELRKRLIDKGFPSRSVDEVIDRVQSAGLQDDARFAERFAGDGAARGKAARLIQRELASKGVERELAAAAATASPEEERERAFELAAKRARGMAGLAPRAKMQRLAGLLARRGFDPETCWRVARELAEAEDDPADDDPAAPDEEPGA